MTGACSFEICWGGVSESLPDGDTVDGSSEYGNVQHDSNRHDPRSSLDSGRATDQSDTANEISGGGVLRSSQQRFSSCATSNSRSQPSRPALFPTSISPDAQPATFQDINSDNDSVKRGESYGTGISSSSGPSLPVGDKRSKSDAANHEIDGGGAVLVSCPSSSTIFVCLATSIPADLKGAGTSQACRAIPRVAPLRS